MYQKRAALRNAACVAALALTTGWVVAQTKPAPRKDPDQTRIIAIEGKGKVDVASGASVDWKAAKKEQVLLVGDRIRTGKDSRATLELSDRSILRVNESTILHLLDPRTEGKKAFFDLRAGSAYFFSRERPADIEFQTPLAVGAIRGTEFILKVAASGETVLALLDGEVALGNSLGQVVLQSGERADVKPGEAPRKTALINAINVIQWCLYYPAVLDVSELSSMAPGSGQEWTPSVDAYRTGDLLLALEKLPPDDRLTTDDARVFAAAVKLAVGQVDKAEALLAQVQRPSSQAQALRQLIAAVQHKEWKRENLPASASEWIAESYYLQSRSNLEQAHEAALWAVNKSRSFGHGWVRLAELEFSLGKVDDALVSLNAGLALSPRTAQAHALRGFVLSSQNKWREAVSSFDKAIEIDPALGSAWLGRGLARMTLGDTENGRKDLQAAAAIEPDRSEFRSYLGKAFHVSGDDALADKELRLARKLDPNDPTPWLYAALLHQRQNRINEAVRELEESQALNDNRALFRSSLLLDQDRAVRSANLASLYKDAGLFDVSVREAARAVDYDYGNYSAHLFLANSYALLRDPRGVNNRFETVESSELLVANLLAPVGAASLSQNRSVQDFSRLVEGKNLGVSSLTEYSSNGDWTQYGSQYGTFGNTAYAFDATYRSLLGFRPNNDFERLNLSLQVKQQLTPKDSIYVQGIYSDGEGGDLRLLYDQSTHNPDIRVNERHEPDLFVGYHHEWSPGLHTLVLAGRLDAELSISDPTVQPVFLRHSGSRVTSVLPVLPSPFQRETSFDAYTLELQQVWQTPNLTLVGGSRYQAGNVSVDELLNLRQSGPMAASFEEDLERFSAYFYSQWQVLPSVRLVGGLSYDRLEFPRNVDTAPATPGTADKDQVSPKVGIVYEPCKGTTVRASYTRSLGGLFYDNSIRLEPTHIAGFNQAYRSIAPESVVGLVPGTEFESYGLALDHTFRGRTFVVLGADVLRSDADRAFGVVTNSNFFPVPNRASSSNQTIEFEERSVLAAVNQLVGDHWSIGARYRISEADLNGRFTSVPVGTPGARGLRQDENAVLHELAFNLNYYLPCGFFSEFQSVWRAQSNEGYATDIPGDDFWQHHVFLGYRFLRRAVEVRLGVLNLSGNDYQLNPLNWHVELPRERIFTTSLRMNF